MDPREQRRGRRELAAGEHHRDPPADEVPEQVQREGASRGPELAPAELERRAPQGQRARRRSGREASPAHEPASCRGSCLRALIAVK